MPTFSYHAVDREDVSRSGTIEADTLAAAVSNVEAMELDVLRIEAGDHVDSGLDQVGRAPRSEPLGPRPASPPRPLPPNVTGAAGGWFWLIFGGLFAGIASVFIAIGLVLVIIGESEGWFFIGFPLIHFSIGAAALYHGISQRQKRRRLAVDGIATVAEVEHVGLDHTIKMNGQKPFKLQYSFEVGGQPYTGKRSTFNRAMTAHIPDDTIWVLYDPEDPSSNMEWPPL